LTNGTLARQREFIDVPLNYILHKLIDGAVPALGREVSQLLFRFGVEVYFHALSIMRKLGPSATLKIDRPQALQSERIADPEGPTPEAQRLKPDAQRPTPNAQTPALLLSSSYVKNHRPDPGFSPRLTRFRQR